MEVGGGALEHLDAKPRAGFRDGVVKAIAQIPAVEIARRIGSVGTTPARLTGLGFFEPAREMSGIVREQAHALGANVEKMVAIVGSVGEAAARRLRRADEQDPRLVGKTLRELDRQRGPGEAGAEDQDIVSGSGHLFHLLQGRLAEPDGPGTATNSPASTARLMPRSAETAPATASYSTDSRGPRVGCLRHDRLLG